MDTTTFFFNASGCALGGEIRQPVSKMLTVAATSLPITGGAGQVTESTLQLPGVVDYTSATTNVAGKRNDDGSHKTDISSTVEKLNIGGVVMADRVVGKLSSNFLKTDSENCIDATGSEFVNLQIGGYAVTVELDLTLFSDLNTMGKFKSKYQSDPTFKKIAQKQFLWDDVDGNAPDWLKQRYSWVRPAGAIPESKGIVPCSIVKTVTCSNPDVQIFGNVIIVAKFGTIFLGEILLKANERRLTMMRIVMDPATVATPTTKTATASTTMMSAAPAPPSLDGVVGIGGDVVVCEIGGNGTTYP